MVQHLNTLSDLIDVLLFFQDRYFSSSSQVMYQNNVCILQYLFFKNHVRVLRHHNSNVEFLYILYLRLFSCSFLNFTTFHLIKYTAVCLYWYVLQF
jgi:hypothetical protein